MAASRSSDPTAHANQASTAALLTAAAGELALMSDSPVLDAELLLAFATDRQRSSLFAFPERVIDAAAAGRFADLVARRAHGEPVAYLTGTREFFSLRLDVGPEVLVPRPETELLVEVVLAQCAPLPLPTVLDIGTGSGAIALTVKHERPHAAVTATDVSAAALGVARANAARLDLDVRWIESDWFGALGAERFDVIVSNPPYVRSAEVTGALAFEPRLALDGGIDGYDAYRKLLAAAPAHLTVGGSLLLEHGHEQRDVLGELAASSGWRVVGAHHDLAGRDRVLVLRRSAAL